MGSQTLQLVRLSTAEKEMLTHNNNCGRFRGEGVLPPAYMSPTLHVNLLLNAQVSSHLNVQAYMPFISVIFFARPQKNASASLAVPSLTFAQFSGKGRQSLH